MDNNMIHIDDLVRQRLSGREEPERPGAWLSMRELLDKEMPVSTGYNWRRVIGYFSVLLLISAASVGGYRLYNSQSGSARLAAGGERSEGAAAYNTNGASGSEPVTSNNSTSQKSNTAYLNNSTASTNTESGNNNSPSLRPSTNAIAVASSGKAGQLSGTENTQERNEKAETASDRESTVHQVSPAGRVAKSSGNRQPNRTSGASATPKTSTFAAAATVRGLRKQSSAANISSDEMHTLEPASGMATGLANTTLPAPQKRETQIIERIEIVSRRVYDAETQKPYYRIDTVPLGKIVIDRIPSNKESEGKVATKDKPSGKGKGFGFFGRKKNNESALDMKDANPASSSGSKELAAANDDKQVLNGTLKQDEPAGQGSNNNSEASGQLNASASSKHFRLWNAEKVQAMMDQVKQTVAKVQMYPGVIAGMNMSLFTPNALGGFQLGMTSLFVLNDWWSLMLEPKYILRYNTGSSIRDDYKQVIDNSGKVVPDPVYPNTHMYYTWTDKTIQHSFNYDVVNTFELPIMLRKAWGQVYAQGGVNLVYSMPIKAKEVTKPLEDHKTHGESRPGPEQPFITNDRPTVQLSDFGSRFGTGYVISGGYMFSPAVCLDLRLAQTFWDNSKTAGAKQVSKDLLRSPSFQISVGYRFNSKK